MIRSVDVMTRKQLYRLRQASRRQEARGESTQARHRERRGARALDGADAFPDDAHDPAHRPLWLLERSRRLHRYYIPAHIWLEAQKSLPSPRVHAQWLQRQRSRCASPQTQRQGPRRRQNRLRSPCHLYTTPATMAPTRICSSCCTVLVSAHEKQRIQPPDVV